MFIIERFQPPKEAKVIMKFATTVVLAAAALANAVSAAPCKHHHHGGNCGCEASSALSAAAPTQTPVGSQNPLSGTPCSNEGEKQCLGKDFGQCNYGAWYVIDCENDTACIPNDYQCVPRSDWDRVNQQVNGNSANLGAAAPTETPAVSKNPLNGTPCDQHGLQQCLGNDYGICNWGTWVVTDCINNTRCTPFDYECVSPADYERLNQAQSSTEQVASAAAPSSSPCETTSTSSCSDACTDNGSNYSTY